MSAADDVLGLEAEDLDGYSIEDLSDYLDRGRQPADPAIDESPACQIALGALQRLHEAAGSIVAPRPSDDPGIDDWIGDVIAALSIEAHAGRRFPFPIPDPRIDATVTEGALRGLVRAVGDDVPGVLVGSVRFETDADAAVAAVGVHVAIAYGHPIPEAVDRLRAALVDALRGHAPFAISRVDLRVVDVLDLREARA